MSEDDVIPAPSFSWTIFGFAAFAIVTLIVFFTAVNYSDPARAGVYIPGPDCNILTCPIGGAGPSGPSGPSGIGRKGDKGDKGDQGPQGPLGPQGNPGVAMCLANPGCGVGPQGEPGPSGATGPRGAPGFDGRQGPQGEIGPQGFVGPSGPAGATGPQGIQGIQGIPGVCDCFNISSIEFPQVNITSDLNLQNGAILTCSNGSHIDAASCFAQGAACPDYSQCFIPINQVHVKANGFVPPILQVGGTFVSNSSNSGAFLGECNYYKLDVITMCSANTEIGTLNGPMHLFSMGGNTLIETMGGFDVLQITGAGSTILSSTSTLSPLQITANGGMIISNFGFNGINVSSTIGNIDVSVPTAGFNVVASTFSVLQSDGNTPWLESYPSVNYQNQMAESRMAVLYGPSIIMSGNDTAITTIDPSGTVRIGPFIDVGGGRIFSQQINLRLGTGVFFNQWISLEAPVRNVAGNGNPSAYRNLAAEHIWFDDEVRVGGNSTFDGDVSIEGGLYNANPSFPTAACGLSAGYLLINDDTYVNGNVYISGNLNVAGTTGNSCPSDVRVKKNVQTIGVDDSIARIQLLRPTQYEFTEPYQAIDSNVGNGTHLGFIAQEVEQIMPSAVKRKKNALYADFRTLEKDEIIADLVNVVQYLLKRIEGLESR